MSSIFSLLGGSLSTLLACLTSLLVYLIRRELPSLLHRNKYPGNSRLTHVVSTLEPLDRPHAVQHKAEDTQLTPLQGDH